MKANCSYYKVGKDVVTEVFGKRGYSSLVSSIIGPTKSEKKKTKEAERLQEEIDALRRDHGQDATTAWPSIGRRGTDGMSDRLYNDLPVIEHNVDEPTAIESDPASETTLAIHYGRPSVLSKYDVLGEMIDDISKDVIASKYNLNQYQQ
ncbi:hypothetical protein L1987_68849 [Smallanthus sonchifolius]|uniref:Uncharacterized protein n=1 Tax=Smallanthus sonchifolius TaxID=185202 RepID=A0ACB9B4A7_9ASTR|nr:hypothetical protein L1987_68849 [Smallanthus sonchifolius]